MKQKKLRKPSYIARELMHSSVFWHVRLLVRIILHQNTNSTTTLKQAYLDSTSTSSRVSTYPCFILYTVSKRDKTNDIHLRGLST